ncbi:MAG: hypothetical protein CSA62_08575 [Planctomycetota bacterium]|nr:MAG: hypothetical protein CSA62_08575 [Planctomycetota bacterium]
MLLLLGLGVWIVTSPSRAPGLPELREGAYVLELRLGKARGALEVLEEGGQRSYRWLWRDRKDHAASSPVFGPDTLRQFFGDDAEEHFVAGANHPLFRVFAITSVGSLFWVLLGFIGQAAFFGRMALQWIASEREQRSVVPSTFWVLSLLGGILLFTYFAWRKDIVGVLGQSTGIVIYARNLRLIRKELRSQRKAAAS